MLQSRLSHLNPKHSCTFYLKSDACRYNDSSQFSMDQPGRENLLLKLVRKRVPLGFIIINQCLMINDECSTITTRRMKRSILKRTRQWEIDVIVYRLVVVVSDNENRTWSQWEKNCFKICRRTGYCNFQNTSIRKVCSECIYCPPWKGHSYVYLFKWTIDIMNCDVLLQIILYLAPILKSRYFTKAVIRITKNKKLRCRHRHTTWPWR